MQPTMSKAGLLLQCGWAFRNPLVPKTIANVPMRYGSAFHEIIATALEAGVPPKLSIASVSNVAKKFNMEDSIEELRKHTDDAYKELLYWLNGHNAWELKLLPAPKGAIIIEKAIAYDTSKDAARYLAPVNDDHVYEDATDDDHPGTVDIAINLRLYGTRVPARLRKAVIILDHKTGVSFDNPRDSFQLRSLAVAFSRLWKGDGRAIVGINHAPRDGIPAVFADELTPEELNAHAEALQGAFPRIGDGSLRPGSECGYCAGNSVCPVYGGSLADLTRDLRTMGDASTEPLEQEARKAIGLRQKLDISTPEGIGTVHMILQMMDRVRDDWSERIKQRLRDNPELCGVRPDGMVSIIKTTERENLSLASIKRACKPKRAAEIEKILRDEGCIEKLPREELRAVKDR